MTWDRVSSKTVWDDLKPTVLTLAMLLPVTSSLVWWARRPEMAENIERSTGGVLSGGGERGQAPGEAGREISVRRPRGTSRPPTTAVGSSPPKRTEDTVPVCVVPSSAVQLTAWPTRAPADSERCSDSSAAFCVAICSSFSTCVNVAVCDMNSVVLVGLLGSWYFICATRSCRNVSLPIWSLRSTDVAAVYVAGLLLTPPTGSVIVGSRSEEHTSELQ